MPYALKITLNRARSRLYTKRHAFSYLERGRLHTMHGLNPLVPRYIHSNQSISSLACHASAVPFNDNTPSLSPSCPRQMPNASVQNPLTNCYTTLESQVEASSSVSCSKQQAHPTATLRTKTHPTSPAQTDMASSKQHPHPTT